MQSRVIELTVGFFILAGILALGFLAIQVSGINREFDSKGTYRLYAEFNNVAGLTAKAKVTVAGVQVGQVTAITISPQSMRARVDMVISNTVKDLSEDTIAAIQTAGILGEKYIALSPGGVAETLGDGDRVRDTQSALILEELVGRLVTSRMGAP